MKKLFSIFLLMTVAIFPLWSQPNYNSVAFFSVVPEQIEKTIIRELHFPQSISYVETLGTHLFVFHDGDTNNVLSVTIANNLYVNDFVIAHDTVFFCGRNIQGNKGFFGHFRIQDFFWGTQGYTITDFQFTTTQSYVRTFDKMVTYTVGLERRFAAIGRSLTDEYVVTEIIYNPYMPDYHYSIGEIALSYNESVLDITVTDRFVVTAGFKTTNSVFGPLPCVRIYNRASMFATGGPQDVPTYFYQSGKVDTYFDDSKMLISHMQSDEFVLASYWKDNVSPIPQGTYVGLYAIANNSVSHTGSIKTNQASYYQSGGWTLQGMTPKGPASKFFLLQNAEYQTPVQIEFVNMIFELDYNVLYSPPSTGNITFLYREDPYLQSIDANGNTTCFMTNGPYHAHPDDPNLLGYYNSLAVNTINCHDDGFIGYSNLPMGDAPAYNTPFIITGGNGYTVQPNTGVIEAFGIEMGCYE